MADDIDDDFNFDDETADEHEGGEFICPECGGGQVRAHWMVESDPVQGDPWSEILQIQHCATCGSRTPAHLGECWDGISLEVAQAEWRNVYHRKQPRT